MSNISNECEEQITQAEKTHVEEKNTSAETATLSENSIETDNTPKKKLTKKKISIIGAIAAVVVIVIVVALIPSKFDKVKNECVDIAGTISSGKGYFTIDTYPDIYEDMDDTMVAILLPTAQKNALKAIKYANEELGFNGSLYSKMTETSALMGRQSEENDKYKVSWTYHPNNGLVVTYEKK